MTGDTVLPSIDEIWDVDGTRDTGTHLFEYSLWPYVDSISPAQLTKVGYLYNEASPTLPFILEGDAVATAFKPTLKGDGFLLRLQEAGGKESPIVLTFERLCHVQPVNLMEEPLEPGENNTSYRCTLSKHQILTLKIR